LGCLGGDLLEHALGRSLEGDEGRDPSDACR
jgi:hypothetical protein